MPRRARPIERTCAMVARPDATRDDFIKSLEEIPGVHVLTRDEAIALFERDARRDLGISGEEFLRRWDAGEYQPVPDTVEGRAIERIAVMIPFVRGAKA
jgi:hypothetical protein